MFKFEPCTIEVDEAAWVVKALGARQVFQLAAIAHYEGSAVLVATDTHRIHMLRLGESKEEFPTKLIDLRRVLFEARFTRSKHIQIDVESQEVAVGNLSKYAGGLATPHRVYAPVFNTIVATFPNFGEVIPQTKRPPQDLFAINSKYLSDAVSLSSKYACRTVVHQSASDRPIVFQPADNAPRWLAVVMPMAIGEWAK